MREAERTKSSVNIIRDELLKIQESEASKWEEEYYKLREQFNKFKDANNKAFADAEYFKLENGRLLVENNALRKEIKNKDKSVENLKKAIKSL